MRDRKFTDEQIEELLKHKFVRKCSKNIISFSSEFKVFAVRKYEEEGFSASRIFEEANLPATLIGEYVADDRMRDWRKTYKIRGIKGLTEENRGKTTGSGMGRPKTKGVTDKDKIERLEATIAYLKAENDFLAKLRAKRRE